MRRRLASPILATSSKSPSATFGEVLSASIRTASLRDGSVGHQRSRCSSEAVAKPSGVSPSRTWKARIAPMVSGPITPSVEPVS